VSDTLPSDEIEEDLPFVLIRPQARADLKEAFIFMAANNLESGLRFLESARATLENLASMPLMGAPRHFRNERLFGIRQWPIKGFRKHLIFYRALENQEGIEVIRISHVTRDLESLLNETEE
jgi:toxin ParE1/3/4